MRKLFDFSGPQCIHSRVSYDWRILTRGLHTGSGQRTSAGETHHAIAGGRRAEEWAGFAHRFRSEFE